MTAYRILEAIRALRDEVRTAYAEDQLAVTLPDLSFDMVAQHLASLTPAVRVTGTKDDPMIKYMGVDIWRGSTYRLD